jgi:glycogen debranching enzyme
VAQSGADRFALKVTYWKDSELNVPGRDREPSYPVAYALVHFQVKSALQAAARMTRSRELRDQARAMTQRGFATFWRDDHFAVAVEATGAVIDAPSSDSLHALLFLRPDEVSAEDADRVVGYSRQLETRVGYRPALAQRSGVDDYHTRWVWVHEQALLHAAARRHGLERAEEVTSRIIPTLDQSFPELIDPDTGQLGGNPTQLWSVGAHVYFQQVRVAGALIGLVEKLDARGPACE